MKKKSIRIPKIDDQVLWGELEGKIIALSYDYEREIIKVKFEYRDWGLKTKWVYTHNIHYLTLESNETS